jgi:hypothetical protein
MKVYKKNLLFYFVANVIFAQQCLIKIDMIKGGDSVPELIDKQTLMICPKVYY